MDLKEPLGSDTVSLCAHRPAQPCADVTDVIWSGEAGQARVEVELFGDGAVTVRLSGEVDVASAPLVEHTVRIVRAARGHHVRLDLSAVSFCDCAGLNAFIASDRLLRAAGGRLTISRLSGPVRRLLRLTKMHDVLTLDRPLDEQSR